MWSAAGDENSSGFRILEGASLPPKWQLKTHHLKVVTTGNYHTLSLRHEGAVVLQQDKTRTCQGVTKQTCHWWTKPSSSACLHWSHFLILAEVIEGAPESMCSPMHLPVTSLPDLIAPHDNIKKFIMVLWRTDLVYLNWVKKEHYKEGTPKI